MDIKITFSSVHFRKVWSKKCCAIYHSDTHKQELFTKRHKSSIKALIHEDVHQLLDEYVDDVASIDYDNIATKLERYLWT